MRFMGQVLNHVYNNSKTFMVFIHILSGGIAGFLGSRFVFLLFFLGEWFVFDSMSFVQFFYLKA